jgi:hypothetical protein
VRERESRPQGASKYHLEEEEAVKEEEAVNMQGAAVERVQRRKKRS